MHAYEFFSNDKSMKVAVETNSISEFDYRSGRFIIVGSTSYSSTHVTVPAWESQEYEILHGHF